MSLLKYTATAIVALIAAAVIYGQSVGRADKIIGKAAVAGAIQRASKQPMAPTAGAPRPDATSRKMEAISALPPDPQSDREMRASYAPSDVFRKQAQALYEAGDLTGAETACLDALNSPPIIHGQPQHVPFVAPLLGRIYLKDGQYAKAIYWLQGAKQHTVDSGLDLNLALAYVRLGDYKNASRLYSDQSILRYLSDGEGVLTQDLPGTNSPKALEASILFARGLDTHFEARDDEALVDLQAANRLAPDNPLIAYHCATILSEERRFAEATPLYERAALGRGFISKEASRRLIGIRAPAGPMRK